VMSPSGDDTRSCVSPEPKENELLRCGDTILARSRERWCEATHKWRGKRREHNREAAGSRSDVWELLSIALLPW
jgi:hypothetical protein